MSLRGELRKLGFGSKLESYFTNQAYRDIRYDPIDIDKVTSGSLMRHISDQKIISDNLVLNFKEILNLLLPNSIQLDDIKIIAVSNYYEDIFCISNTVVDDFKMIILLKKSSDGNCFLKSNLDMITDSLSKSDKELDHEKNKLPKTQRDFKWIQEWFDYQTSLRESKKKQRQNNVAS